MKIIAVIANSSIEFMRHFNKKQTQFISEDSYYFYVYHPKTLRGRIIDDYQAIGRAHDRQDFDKIIEEIKVRLR